MPPRATQVNTNVKINTALVTGWERSDPIDRLGNVVGWLKWSGEAAGLPSCDPTAMMVLPLWGVGDPGAGPKDLRW